MKGVFMNNNKVSTIYTYLVLKKFSSEQNPLNAKQIADYMKTMFHLPKPLDRRTIYIHCNALEALASSFPNLVAFEFHKNVNGSVYIISDFEASEIRLLCDAIATSRFISKQQSQNLIQKLGQITGEDLTMHYQPRLEFKNSHKKTYNAALFTNIDILSEAIKLKRKVSLQYLKFDIQKKLVPMWIDNSGYKVIQPYYLIWAINRYYLMYCYEGSTTPRFLRVDKIRNATILNEMVEPLPKDIHLENYTRNQVFMFGGNQETIQFRCKIEIIGNVIDFFGEDVEIHPIDKDYFDVMLVTSIESIQYWILQYITAIDYIRPKKLSDTIVTMLQDALKRNLQDS